MKTPTADQLVAESTVDTNALRQAAKELAKENHETRVRNAKRILADVGSRLDSAVGHLREVRKSEKTAKEIVEKLATVKTALESGETSDLEKLAKLVYPDGTFDAGHHRARFVESLS